MAQIVYEGVGGGDLFKDMKFYVLQRVPLRSKWLSLIESNGGEVTKTDKNITYLIADHARKDAPEGSISWTWIEQSVKNGCLEDIEAYRAGPQKRAVREIASGQPIRVGRVPFTAEDDKALMSWVSHAERKGLSSKGNDIYKQFEKKNPRHTFQSWRDRWIKQVSLQPRPQEVSDNDDDDGPLPPPTNFGSHRAPQHPPPSQKLPEKAIPRSRTAEKSNPAKRPRASSATDSDNGRETSYSSKMTSNRRSTPEPPSKIPQPHSESPKAVKPKFRRPKSISAPSSPGSIEGNPFTKREKNRCLQEYDSIMNLDEKQTIDAWITWARLYPTHTAQEWRNFFADHIIPLKEEEKLAAGGGDMQQEKEGENALSQHSKPPRVVASPAPASPSLAPSKSTEIKDSQEASGETPDSQSHPRSITDPTATHEETFKNKLASPSLTTENVLEPSYNHIIDGRDISLFQLWQVVYQFGGYERVTNGKLWSTVAKKLDFDQTQHKTAPLDLKKCFIQHRTEFEPVWDECMAWDNASPSVLEELTPSKKQLYQFLKSQEKQSDLDDEPHTDDYNDDLDHPLSTPKQRLELISTKRRSDDSSSDSRLPNNKRRRTEKAKTEFKEIPSTPEDIIHGTRTTRHPEPSPSKQRADIEGYSDEVEDEEEDDLEITVVGSISSVLPQKMQQFEPQTQDFHFTPPGEVDKSSLVTTSPERSKAVHIHGSSSEATEEDLVSDDGSSENLTGSQKAIELENFVDGWESLGYKFDVIVEALQATCGLQEKGPQGIFGAVVEALTKGRGIPEDIRGVWTTLDDEILEAGSKDRRFSRLIVKHGSSGVIGRRKFLAEAKESGL